jgi:hypothetical protein
VEPTKQIATARGWRRTQTDSAPSTSTPGSACDNASDGGERPQAGGTDRGRLRGTGCVDDVPVDLFDEFVDRPGNGGIGVQVRMSRSSLISGPVVMIVTVGSARPAVRTCAACCSGRPGRLDGHPAAAGVLSARQGRCGFAKAVVATTRKMTVLAWHLVNKDQDCACDRPRTGQSKAAQARARGGFQRDDQGQRGLRTLLENQHAHAERNGMDIGNGIDPANRVIASATRSCGWRRVALPPSGSSGRSWCADRERPLSSPTAGVADRSPLCGSACHSRRGGTSSIGPRRRPRQPGRGYLGAWTAAPSSGGVEVGEARREQAQFDVGVHGAARAPGTAQVVPSRPGQVGLTSPDTPRIARRLVRTRVPQWTGWIDQGMSKLPPIARGAGPGWACAAAE